MQSNYTSAGVISFCPTSTELWILNVGMRLLIDACTILVWNTWYFYEKLNFAFSFCLNYNKYMKNTLKNVLFRKQLIESYHFRFFPNLKENLVYYYVSIFKFSSFLPVAVKFWPSYDFDWRWSASGRQIERIYAKDCQKSKSLIIFLNWIA